MGVDGVLRKVEGMRGYWDGGMRGGDGREGDVDV